jgi:hypothetical protein
MQADIVPPEPRRPDRDHGRGSILSIATIGAGEGVLADLWALQVLAPHRPIGGHERRERRSPFYANGIPLRLRLQGPPPTQLSDLRAWLSRTRLPDCGRPPRGTASCIAYELVPPRSAGGDRFRRDRIQLRLEGVHAAA